MSPEQILGKALKASGLKIRAQYRPHKTRLWRFDWVISPVSSKIAIECEGRAHQRLSQVRKDCDKFNWCISKGWRVFRYPAATIMTAKRLPLIVDQIKSVAYDCVDDSSTHQCAGD